LGWGVVLPGLLFGLLTTFSSFLAIGLVLRETLQFDFRFPAGAALGMALGLPLLLYLWGWQELTRVLGVTGAIFLGLEGIVVVLITTSFWRRQGKLLKRRAAGLVLLSLSLGVGVLAAIVNQLRG
jgi:hypothetical protein